MNFQTIWTITVMAIVKQLPCLCTKATVKNNTVSRTWKIILLGPDSEQCGTIAVASQCLTSKDITPSKSPVLPKPAGYVQMKDRLLARKYIHTYDSCGVSAVLTHYLNTHCTFNTAYWFNENECRHELTGPCSGLIFRNITIMKNAFCVRLF